MLLSVVSAVLFKMRSTGLVDILGPVHDARLCVTGSLATYVSDYDYTDFFTRRYYTQRDTLNNE